MVNQDDGGKSGISIAVPILTILLLLSLCLNYFLWRFHDTGSQQVAVSQSRLIATQTTLAQQEERAQLMKAMLGLGALTPAEFNTLKQMVSNDPEMNAITANYVRDMGMFGPDVQAQNRNYPALAVYLNNTIAQREVAYQAARDAANQAQSNDGQD